MKSIDIPPIWSEADPRDPNSWCEQALKLVYSGHETEALAHIDHARGADKFAKLAQILGDHLFCRLQLHPTDSLTAEALGTLGGIYQGPSANIGTRISACLITKNEEANLDRCLKSLHGIVDEIIVVDTGSTDQTIHIARTHGAKIGRFTWCDDFSAARNAALDLATGNWILWIDADEELTSSSRQAIQRAVVRPHFGGFDIEIVNFTDERENGSEFRHYPTRLFRHLPEIRFEGRIHEQITPSLRRLGLVWARLEGTQILHYGYRPEAMARLNKMERTLSMLEREVRENPADPFQWFNLANAQLIARRYTDAEHAARQCIRRLDASADYGSLVWQILVTALVASGRLTQALLACDQADSCGCGGILNEFERAQVLMKLEQPEEALVAINRCVELDWRPGSTGDQGIASFKRYLVRAQIQAVLGNYDAARADAEYALSVDPGFAPTQYTLAAILERQCHFDLALEHLEKAALDADSRPLALRARARILATLGRQPEAIDAYELAWRHAHDDFELWICWVNALEQRGDVNELLRAYEAFAEVQEPTAEILINWGRALERAGDVERALHCFTEAINRDPNNSNGYFNAGDLLYRQGAPHDAAHLYQSGLRYDPMNPEGWFTLGNALAQMGLEPGAVTAYRQVLELRPNHPGALHNLGVLTEAA